MNSVKKIIACTLICFHATNHTNDETLYGVILAGLAITGIAVAGKIVRNSALEAQKELEKNCMAAQALLLKTDKYVQTNTHYSSYRTQEKALEYLYQQLRFGHSHNTDNLIAHLEKEIQELKTVQKNISSPFSQSNEITNLQKKIALRLKICLALLTIVEEHVSYFKLCDMHNNYAAMPMYQSKVIEWIMIQSNNSLYPLLHYKEKATQDIAYIDSCHLPAWPEIIKKNQSTKKEIQRSLTLLHASDKIIIEAQNKKQNEMQEAQIEAIQDKNNIALRGVKAQEQIARDQAEIARMSRNKAAEIARQNYLLAQQYPVDQEKNRLQAEKNRLDGEKNRLLSERNRIDLFIAENRRREIAALEVQNRLQAERNQREQEGRNPSHVYTQAHVAPSAPPAENESNNIPLARPYSGANLPEATVVYPKK